MPRTKKAKVVDMKGAVKVSISKLYDEAHRFVERHPNAVDQNGRLKKVAEIEDEKALIKRERAELARILKPTVLKARQTAKGQLRGTYAKYGSGTSLEGTEEAALATWKEWQTLYDAQPKSLNHMKRVEAVARIARDKNGWPSKTTVYSHVRNPAQTKRGRPPKAR